MIDIYNEIYTQLSNRLHVDFPDIYMANEYLFTTAQFPCVTVEETDNYTLADTQTNRLYENPGVLCPNHTAKSPVFPSRALSVS